MGEKLGRLQPQILWNHFEEICKIPRPSRKEEKISQYIISFAKKNNLEYKVDKFGNILVKKKATEGKENLQTVTLQCHLDMVAEKNSDVQHDFEKDPIQPYVDGDWVKAKGTTLGADNGIGVAAALAVLESKEIEHGPIEALFTLDEETGLFGAQALQPGFAEGKILLNMDSEEDSALYIGCAGGQNTFAKFVSKLTEPPKNSTPLNISVKGLKGGHSGLDISAGKGNAIKIMARLLIQLFEKFDIRLISINGGSKHNAIPRECFADIRVNSKFFNDVTNFVEDYNKIIQSELSSVEPELNVSASQIKSRSKIMDKASTYNLLAALYAVPHGVIKMSADIPGLVETSTNLAVVETKGKNVNIITSQRSSVDSEKNDISSVVATIFKLAKAEVKHGDGYPGWKPDIHSPILGIMKSVFNSLYGKEPEVKAIHAGLECGIIKEKYPQMDMISFGPTIIGAHSPDERVQISTVARFWELLLNVLKSVPAN
ncbi:aminoacyl-histidine dipeptidase [Melioribacteraceae bacterium 4301-Me]|uniref:aminoacyl-histidine dipeptidase n=1 Tax=Pyranulibacter aquaticus TaxID=3163344 RepID=UPI00359BE34D